MCSKCVVSAYVVLCAVLVCRTSTMCSKCVVSAYVVLCVVRTCSNMCSKLATMRETGCTYSADYDEFLTFG
jgi:hypothetical protein